MENLQEVNGSRPLMVTIQCLTYNHEPYIRQCLEGFVMQKTNFRFEAIVHDDASTDGTATIIREYAEKYPDIILMADISNYEEGVNAWKCGVDIVGTTMSGYTAYTSKKDEPDYELMERLAKDIDIPVIGEGKIHYPDQAVKALKNWCLGNCSRWGDYTSVGNCSAFSVSY